MSRDHFFGTFTEDSFSDIQGCLQYIYLKSRHSQLHVIYNKFNMPLMFPNLHYDEKDTEKYEKIVARLKRFLVVHTMNEYLKYTTTDDVGGDVIDNDTTDKPVSNAVNNAVNNTGRVINSRTHVDDIEVYKRRFARFVRNNNDALTVIGDNNYNFQIQQKWTSSEHVISGPDAVKGWQYLSTNLPEFIRGTPDHLIFFGGVDAGVNSSLSFDITEEFKECPAMIKFFKAQQDIEETHEESYHLLIRTFNILNVSDIPHMRSEEFIERNYKSIPDSIVAMMIMMFIGHSHPHAIYRIMGYYLTEGTAFNIAFDAIDNIRTVLNNAISMLTLINKQVRKDETLHANMWGDVLRLYTFTSKDEEYFTNLTTMYGLVCMMYGIESLTKNLCDTVDVVLYKFLNNIFAAHRHVTNNSEHRLKLLNVLMPEHDFINRTESFNKTYAGNSSIIGGNDTSRFEILAIDYNHNQNLDMDYFGYGV